MPFLKKQDKGYIPRSKRLEQSTYRQGLRHAISNYTHDLYKGVWKDDVKCGKGVMWTAKGQIYEGDFDRNYRHGFGTLARKLPHCDVYQLEYRGEWQNGRMHGEGVRVYPDGSFYIGRLVKGKREGFGQMWYADNSFYSGDWYKDKKDGLGLFVDPIGNRYEGQWSEDCKHGDGIYYHLDSGQMQEGLWKHDICIVSIIRDIPFRQTSQKPTPLAIPKSTLLNITQFFEDLVAGSKIIDRIQLCDLSNVHSRMYSYFNAINNSLNYIVFFI